MDSDVYYEHPYGVTKFPNYRSDIDYEDVAKANITDEQMKQLLSVGSISQKCNPKDKAGSLKVGMHVIPPSVLMQIALALEEGELKYSGFNWRSKETPITYSKYYDAVMRHMAQHFEGEDIDAQSGVSHIIKAAATLIVLYDAMQQNNLVDDRPIKNINHNWMDDMNASHVELVARVMESKKC